jgi:hypothetical protein
MRIVSQMPYNPGRNGNLILIIKIFVKYKEELFERKSSGSGLKKTRLRTWGSAALTTRHPLYPQKFAQPRRQAGGRSVGIVRSQTKATELLYYYVD